MVDPTPITDAGLAETVAAVENWHSRVAKFNNAIDNNDALSGPVKYASDRVSSAYSNMTRLLVENALPLVHRLRTAEADLAASRGLSVAAIEQISIARARAEKAEAEVARLLTANKALTQAALLAKGSMLLHVPCDDDGKLPSDVEAALAAMVEAGAALAALRNAASRPDPAQPGLSGAKTAAERAVLDATMRLWWNNFTLPKSVADACAALDRITGAAPPAAGSAAGMGE